MTSHQTKRKPKRFWTEAEIEVLRQLYPTTRSSDIARLINRTSQQIYDKANRLKIRKPPETIARLASEAMRKPDHGGRKALFQKGLTPWNKGIKFDSGGRSHETQFKKGHKPHTWNPVGHERVSKEGYLQRKLTDTGVTRRDYVPIHHIVWKEAGREIPEGYALIFKDGNKRNFALDNLELLHRSELMRRNSYHNHGPEIAKLIQLQGAITRQINKRKKKPND